jgi:hypothetical protein
MSSTLGGEGKRRRRRKEKMKFSSPFLLFVLSFLSFL